MDRRRPRHRWALDDEPDPDPAWAAAQKKTLIATERDEVARAAWRAELAEVDPETVVFLDETSTQTVMTRTRGRAPRGARVIGAVPRNRGPNITCLVALGATGTLAPCVFEGAVTSDLFVRWLQEWLVPTLVPGTTVVLDNLAVHRHAAVRSAIEEADCALRYLPPYSPDFNPIELAFSKLKTHLRGAAARSYETVLTAIGTGLDRITPADIRGYYAHCGFPLPEPDGQPI
ncbi:MAG TPA: IS630 family transposase [Thermomicrobiales bacterium]|nr:IS630 family transposase [Thermomicrobiales bacterium]